MKSIRNVFAILSLAFAVPAMAQVSGPVNLYEMNTGSTSQFHRFTIKGVSSGCGSSLASSSTYFYFDSNSTFAAELSRAVQLSKTSGAPIQVWWGSNCQVLDIVQV